MQASAAAPRAIGQAEDDRALTAVFTAYVTTATVWLVIATAVGLLLAFKFGAPDFWAAKFLTPNADMPTYMPPAEAAPPHG